MELITAEFEMKEGRLTCVFMSAPRDVSLKAGLLSHNCGTERDEIRSHDSTLGEENSPAASFSPPSWSNGTHLTVFLSSFPPSWKVLNALF